MNKTRNTKIDPAYAALVEEDKKYGGKKLERPRTEVKQKRSIQNLKKAWMDHPDDFDEIDAFFED